MNATTLTAPVIVARAYRAEERFWTDLLKAHECWRCANGFHCCLAAEYTARADDAGLKAERAGGQR